jgi:hypothetical protein
MYNYIKIATTLSSLSNVLGKSNGSGNTSGNNPIVDITQNNAWDISNYALPFYAIFNKKNIKRIIFYIIL